jgi:hypothetical protein
MRPVNLDSGKKFGSFEVTLPPYFNRSVFESWIVKGGDGMRVIGAISVIWVNVVSEIRKPLLLKNALQDN